MIIVKLMGGLGNQMFQYALGRHLSLKHGVELRLDISHFKYELDQDKFSARDLELSNFNTNFGLVNATELKRHEKGKFSKILDLIYLNLPLKFNHLYIREPFFTFYKKTLDAPNDTYLDGYWQSENYFSDIRNVLLNDFTLVSKKSNETKQLEEKIRSETSVSIHIRRGDYLSIKENQNLYAACDVSYYVDAIRRISEANAEVVFYVFSDEPDWFKKNVNTVGCKFHFVTHNIGKNSYQDLHLMSLCKHNIIANSSFSWWGAWLNQHENKMVIAPQIWFVKNTKDSRDLIPKSWTQL